MKEIKYRVEAIDSTLAGEVKLRAKIAEELCYLQLRMICELIAIGCLVIHGNLSPKPDLLKTYKADWIMTELAKLHARFFPTPLMDHDEMEGSVSKWTHKTAGFLTQKELSELWSRQAGGRLHRGNARNILKKEMPLEFPAVRAWRDKIVQLLNRHIISSPDEKTICYFVMSTPPNDEVGWNLFEQVQTLPAVIPARS